LPLVAQMVCDNCQMVKKQTNHCYAISLEKNSFCLKPVGLTADWASKSSPDSSVQYFCGRFCVVEALTRWMNNLHDETKRFPLEPRSVAPE
jgi:hypothetical protein